MLIFIITSKWLITLLSTPYNLSKINLYITNKDGIVSNINTPNNPPVIFRTLYKSFFSKIMPINTKLKVPIVYSNVHLINL